MNEKIVSINEVNIEKGICNVVDMLGTPMILPIQKETITVIPQAGEIWLIAGGNFSWRFVRKKELESEQQLTDLEPGDVRIGSGGRIFLKGTEIIVADQDLISRLEAIEAAIQEIQDSL